MKRFLISTIAFFVTFIIVFSLLSGILGRVNQSIVPVANDKGNPRDKDDFGVPEEWLTKYDVTLNNFIDAELDIDNDGLSLVAEYKYKTDPTKSDTDGDGYSDGDEIENGYSPNGSGLMDTNSNNIPDKWEIDNMGLLVSDEFDDSDNDGLVIYDEYIFGTDPKKSDTDGDGYSDGDEVNNGYDPMALGDIRPEIIVEINKINVEVPVVLSNDAAEEKLQEDLNDGVIHYPGTAMPGRRGNMYVAGHSSNYIWSKGIYDNIFKNLNDLTDGDEIIVKTKQQNGKEINYKYVVTLNEEVAPDDSRIFADTQSQELTLTTCWPLGTNARRIMVKAQLEEV
ncbi:MAG: sortase [Candidatus Moraniibacteriota bacterium]|jgi:LPXTG-site transpeptidase (sortase) family protein